LKEWDCKLNDLTSPALSKNSLTTWQTLCHSKVVLPCGQRLPTTSVKIRLLFLQIVSDLNRTHAVRDEQNIFHDELVIQCEAGSLELQAENMDKKYPHVRSICEELQKKYAYADEDYLVIAPQNTFDIIKEGRMLHHCVGNDGAGERYYDRIERRESFIMFLRRAEEPEDPYYTLEIEPDGTVRQKRTLFDASMRTSSRRRNFCRSGKKSLRHGLQAKI